MKTRILTQFVTAAVGIALPLSIVAQDLSDQTNSGSPDTSAAMPDSSTQGSGNFSFGSSPSSQSQPGSFSSGIMVHDGSAYVIHRLQNEMKLPDGKKVQPDGTIQESDGSTRSIGSGKILTLDGREMEAPFAEEKSSLNSSSPAISNPAGMPGSGSSLPGGQGDSSNSQIGNPSDPNSSLNEQSSGSGLAPGSIGSDGSGHDLSN